MGSSEGCEGDGEGERSTARVDGVKVRVERGRVGVRMRVKACVRARVCV